MNTQRTNTGDEASKTSVEPNMQSPRITTEFVRDTATSCIAEVVFKLKGSEHQRQVMLRHLWAAVNDEQLPFRDKADHDGNDSVAVAVSPHDVGNDVMVTTWAHQATNRALEAPGLKTADA